MKMLVGMAVMAVMIFLLHDAGLRINLTPSMPRGLYRLQTGDLGHGDLVSFCLDGAWANLASDREYLRPGMCPSGLRPLLKTLVALPGDTISVHPAHISVLTDFSGSCIWPVTTLAKDSKGRTLPGSALQSGEVPPGYGLVLSRHEGSFDSRHFGLIPLSTMTRVEPVFMFDQGETHYE